MKTIIRITSGTTMLLALLAFQPAHAAVISVQPWLTYLRTFQDDVGAAAPISLASLGVQPGDYVQLRRLGAFNSFLPQHPEYESNSMIGVFSASSNILASTERHRVPDAIDAGLDVITVASLRDGLDTDIPEDFAIEDVLIRVPAGASYLFVSAHDCYYGDNGDLDGDFAVEISVVPSQAASLELAMFTVAGVTITGTVGRAYRLEFSDSLPATSWTTLTNVVLPSSPYLYVDLTSRTNATQRFYRACVE